MYLNRIFAELEGKKYLMIFGQNWVFPAVVVAQQIAAVGSNLKSRFCFDGEGI